MADQFVQISPDSTGKKVQTFENTIGVNVVESQGIVVVDPASGSAVVTSTTDPVGTERALITRSIPNGTQVVALGNDLGQSILTEMRRQTVLLRILLGATGVHPPGDDEIDAMSNNNPALV